MWDRENSGGYWGHILLLICVVLMVGAVPARAERIYFAGYKGGFYIKSEEQGGMELRLGGSFQADYRHYLEDQRADNRFDIRRARLIFRGQLTRWFRFGMTFEFQGNETNNLLDAYIKAIYGNHGLKFGQFKEPFSLQWQTGNKAQFFAERSMGYCLGPKRDLGAMLAGEVLGGTIDYALGLFNGDGNDGSTRGSEHDEPELAGRLVLAPFKNAPPAWYGGFHLGFSGTYARIDTLNVDLKVKSTGMYGTGRNLYELTHNTKFGVLQSAGDRLQWAAEAAWTMGPFAIQSEYVHLRYADLKPAGRPAADADFSTWYVSLHYCLTGEPLVISRGKMKPVYPARFFDPREGTYGALCLSARFDHFDGDPDWINPAAHVSVETAEAYCLAAKWVLFPMVRVIADWTHTDLSDPVRVRVLPDGGVDYIEEENVFTLRFSMDF